MVAEIEGQKNGLHPENWEILVVFNPLWLRRATLFIFLLHLQPAPPGEIHRKPIYPVNQNL